MIKLPTKKILWIKILTYIVVFFAMISSLVAGFFVVYIRTPVKGISMTPTLNINYNTTGEKDIVYINRFANVQVDDIVVLDLTKHHLFGDFAIKRLIAVEGDVVNLVYNVEKFEYQLIVNDTIIQSKKREEDDDGLSSYSLFRDYLNLHKGDNTRIKQDEHGNIQGVFINEGEVFVMGDNWDASNDSTKVGPLKKKTIVGRVDIIVKPNQNELWTVLKSIF